MRKIKTMDTQRATVPPSPRKPNWPPRHSWPRRPLENAAVGSRPMYPWHQPTSSWPKGWSAGSPRPATGESPPAKGTASSAGDSGSPGRRVRLRLRPNEHGGWVEVDSKAPLEEGPTQSSSRDSGRASRDYVVKRVIRLRRLDKDTGEWIELDPQTGEPLWKRESRALPRANRPLRKGQKRLPSPVPPSNRPKAKPVGTPIQPRRPMAWNPDKGIWEPADKDASASKNNPPSPPPARKPNTSPRLLPPPKKNADQGGNDSSTSNGGGRGGLMPPRGGAKGSSGKPQDIDDPDKRDTIPYGKPKGAANSPGKTPKANDGKGVDPFDTIDEPFTVDEIDGYCEGLPAG